MADQRLFLPAALACLACGGAPDIPSGAAAPTGGGRSEPVQEELLPGQHVFADGEVLEVRLSIAADRLKELEEHGDREEYLPASARLQTRARPAEEFTEIGVRHKGSYSLHHCWDEFGGQRNYDDECAKLSLKLKFDRSDDDTRFDGLKRLNLHSASADPTLLHELLGYRTFRDFGVDAPRAVPARVYVNDEFEGLFIAVEDVDGRYTRAHFPDGPNGNLYKETWPNPLFTEAELRAALQTNEAAGNVSDMLAFASAVGATSAASFASDLAPFVELDALLRYVAVDLALRNWDGVMTFYSTRSSHNFYWYHDDGPAPRFHLIPWDLDQTFWTFHPYTDPEQWVTAPPVPNFNARPLDCSRRPIWDLASIEHITPTRCDKLLNLLAETQWPRLVELGQELLAGAFSTDRLQRMADELERSIAPIVSEDPRLDPAEWQRAVRELSGVLPDAARSFSELLQAGLIDEQPPTRSELTPEQIDVATLDGGLHVGGVTNFEFSAPAGGVPSGVYTYGDPLASVAAQWSADQPLSGAADLRFDFTFQRAPGTYDEWAGVGIAAAESDVRAHSAIVVWLSSDRPRDVRVRLDSPAYVDEFGDVLIEFGVDHRVDTTPRPFVIEFERVYYPSWAKDDWEPGQGFTGDAEALARVLQRFTGLVFGPAATVDATGQLTAESEVGWLRIDNVYFR
jgi:spore coat protein H